jgi:hypothetical protein
MPNAANPVTPHDQSRDQSPALPRGRVLFAVDCTQSRSATWALARDLQGRMFREAAPIGHLDVQLCYYRGDECRATRWLQSGERLAQLMSRIECQSGFTQLARVLAHARREAEKTPVQALTFIGDAMEENIEELASLAGKLGVLGTPIFLFQEGRDPAVEKAYRLMALKSSGAYFRFGVNTARAIEQLSAQLNAIARLAVGDVAALQRLTDQRGRP